jgi:hypothetical protein
LSMTFSPLNGHMVIPGNGTIEGIDSRLTHST